VEVTSIAKYTVICYTWMIRGPVQLLPILNFMEEYVAKTACIAEYLSTLHQWLVENVYTLAAVVLVLSCVYNNM